MDISITLKLQGIKDEIITAIKNSRQPGGVPYNSVFEILKDLRDAYIDDDFLQGANLFELEKDILRNYPEVQKELQKVSDNELDYFIDSFTDFDLRNYHINSLANRFNSKFNINEFGFEIDDSGYSDTVYFSFEIDTWTGVRRFIITQSGGGGVYSTRIEEV